MKKNKGLGKVSGGNKLLAAEVRATAEAHATLAHAEATISREKILDAELAKAQPDELPYAAERIDAMAIRMKNTTT